MSPLKVLVPPFPSSTQNSANFTSLAFMTTRDRLLFLSKGIRHRSLASLSGHSAFLGDNRKVEAERIREGAGLG